METILICCVLLLLGRVAGLQISPDDFLETYTSTEGWVYHITEDAFTTGNILFSDSGSLKTTDGTSTSLIVGSAVESGYLEGVGDQARFYWISSFTQLSSMNFLTVDSKTHCIRAINRLTNTTAPYIGSCEVRGDSDGIDPLFSSPWALIEDIKKPAHFFITESVGRALRYMTVSAGRDNVTTLYRGSLKYYGMVQQESNGDVYITYRHGVAVYDYLSMTMSNLVGSSSSGFVDGFSTMIRFYSPAGIAFLTENLIIIADISNHRLRIIDQITDTSSSICSGIEGHVDGNLTSCQLMKPLSLLIKYDTLYVGEFQRIRKIQGALLNREANTTGPPTETTETTNTLHQTSVVFGETTTSKSTTEEYFTTNDNKMTKDGNNLITTGKATETPILSDVHIAIISGATTGTIVLIAFFISAAYIVRLRTQANSANQRADNADMRLQNLNEPNVDYQNMTGHHGDPTYTTLTQHRSSDHMNSTANQAAADIHPIHAGENISVCYEGPYQYPTCPQTDYEIYSEPRY